MNTPNNASVPYLKCPYCACIFCTQTDLELHLKRFGNNAEQHIKDCKDTNAKIEFGYGVDE
ncbi:MAG: hypothetical protein LBH62_01620 [Nitrososphaerota archaeon]|jgi:uncharacterized C2H2 Zn-finger protein|uniref:hypothetical protein n=1 Tax=Candidatus Bathycorpusculum sp. TaxID=2994959 RepID=UPI00282BDF9B|nr:hypothetical protein [Candidatus Termiticorpusculum sp.]MCL2291892.1 hypothetical protein [Candidatus Termiticorpusculum sp.]MDR0460126.1 hypothetical protein [Nitrososphaerota archaeon]